MTQDQPAKVALFPISPQPSAYTFGVVLEASGSSLTLRYTSEHLGEELERGVSFARVRAFRHRAESHCTPWHVEDCYEEVAQVPNSVWVRELVTDYSHSKPLEYAVNHYIVFFGDSGCYEVAAESARLL